MLSALLSIPVLLLPALQPPPQQGLDRHYWNQHRASAAGDGAVDAEPLTEAPVELWRTPIGKALSDPVVWGGRVYVLAAEKSRRNLLAIDAQSGEVLARTKAGKAGVRGSLVVWQDLVGVLDQDGLQCFLFKKGKLSKSWTRKLPEDAACCLDGPVLYLQADRELSAIDFETGSDLGEVAGGYGRPAVSEAGVAVMQIVSGHGPGVERMHLWVYPRAAQGTSWEPTPKKQVGGDMNGRTGDQEIAMLPAQLLGLAGEPTSRGQLWYMRGPTSLARDGEDFPAQVQGLGDLLMMCPYVSVPVGWGSWLYGFHQNGDFSRQDIQGGIEDLAAAADLPEGAGGRDLSRAGDVLYAGNFAIDLETLGVLWSLPELEPAGPLIPLADRRLLVLDQGGQLLALAGDEADGAAGAQAALELASSRQAITALADAGPAEASTSARALYHSWRGLLARDRWSMLEGQFQAYRKAKLLGECHRLLEEADRAGMPADQRDFLLSQLAGAARNTRKSAEQQRRKLAAKEAVSRAGLLEQYHDAAGWCAEREWFGVAALLHLDASSMSADLEPDLELLRSWMPAGYRDDGSAEAPIRWAAWVRALLPTGARFVDPVDPLLDRARADGWEDGFLALRTENVLALTDLEDPEVVSACVDAGEGAVMVLRELLPQPEGAAFAPLELRLHRRRSDFVDEGRRLGEDLSASVTGQYLTGLDLSLFYLPSPEEVMGRGRPLHEVTRHELTHHYLLERLGWVNQMDPDGPGGWVDEGFARFLETQELWASWPERRFDDATVISVDTCARLLEQDALPPLGPFLETSFRDLAQLYQLPVRDEIKPKHRMMSIRLLPAWTFTEQGGALSFFLANRCGEEGRARLLAYQRAYRERDLEGNGIAVLGFESVEELEAAFHDFLRREG